MNNTPIAIRKLAEGWRHKADRIEARPDAKLAPNLVKHITAALETCAEEAEELAAAIEREVGK